MTGSMSKAVLQAGSTLEWTISQGNNETSWREITLSLQTLMWPHIVRPSHVKLLQVATCHLKIRSGEPAVRPLCCLRGA